MTGLPPAMTLVPHLATVIGEQAAQVLTRFRALQLMAQTEPPEICLQDAPELVVERLAV